MNYSRALLVALGAMVAYFSLGWLFLTRPSMRQEFLKYSAIYRSPEDMRVVIPMGMLGMLLSMLALAALYAMLYRGGSRLVHGAEFGALIGMYALGSFVLHNHVNLRIGAKLTLLRLTRG